MKILILRGDSNNNVLTHMGAALNDGFAALGVQAELYTPTRETGVVGVFRKLLETRAEAVLSFGGGGGDWTTQSGESIYDAAGCAFVGWHVDHPSYNVERLLTPVARRSFISACPAHLRFASALGSPAAGRLLLPGVDTCIEATAPLEARPFNLVAALSWIGEPKVWWNEARGTPAHALVEGVVGRALADPQVDLLAAFETTRAELGIELPIDRPLCKMIADIGLFVRQYDRCRLVQALAEAQTPWVLCGSGWRDWLGDRPHVVFADSLDYLDLAQLYRQARVVVSVNAANGASERVMMAMAAGAAVISDYSPYLVETLGDAVSIYDRVQMNSVVELADALGRDAGTQGQADRGAAAARRHMWTLKAEQIIEELRRLG